MNCEVLELKEYMIGNIEPKKNPQTQGGNSRTQFSDGRSMRPPYQKKKVCSLSVSAVNS